ncbi:hypothetical protein KAR28_05040 [Candidatus Parcubacteria bacterium]|nr:hypothetical protein [Candidatus Parcubacteria bacterium]
MISTNPEAQIRAIIKPGSVFLFADEDYYNSTPHYHVTLNHEPFNDKIILLVCSLTFDSNVYCNIEKSPFPYETYVNVTPGQCKILKKNSLFDCNRVKEKTIDRLIEKLSNKKLKIIGEIEIEIVEELRKAAILSPAIEENIKKMLRI